MSQLMAVLMIGIFACAIGRIQSQQVHLPAEKGQPATLECSFASPVTSITWQLLDADNKEVNLTTCTTTACTDQQPQNFTGHITSSTGGYKSTLHIPGVTVDQTQFKCLADSGVPIVNISIEVYVVASTPTCRQTLVLNKYVDLTCSTDNVYPGFRGALRRRQQPDNLVWDRNASSCTYSPAGSGSKGEGKGQCTFRVLFSSLLETNTFYFEIFPVVWNDTVVNKTAVSRDIQLQLGIPRVVINPKGCPGIDGTHIKNGTNATCRCDIAQSSGLIVNGFVRWFKKDETIVGDEDPSGRFSILNVAYNASDPDAEYDCRAVNPSGEYYHILFKPIFKSSASAHLISGLTVVMALTAAFIGSTFQIA